MLHRKALNAGFAAMAMLFTGFNNSVLAAPIFAAGDVITYSQNNWGDVPAGTNAAMLLLANYNVVYTGGVVEIGIAGAAGFSITFTDRNALLAYLPAIGGGVQLFADHVNPVATSSGAFAGDVMALRLDVDFADAGVTLGALGIPFGDLTLTNFSALPLLNDLTVRQYLDVVNTLLGGGTANYDINELGGVTDDLTRSFEAGFVSTFAEEHLRVTQTPTQVPEPATAGLVLLGSLAIGLVRRRRRV